MIRVIVSMKARGDFREIVAYLSKYAGAAVAKRYASEIDDCIALIAERPGMALQGVSWEPMFVSESFGLLS